MREIQSGDEMVAQPGSEPGPQADGSVRRQSARVGELVLVLHVRRSRGAG